MRIVLFIVCLMITGSAFAQGGGAATAKMPPGKVCVNRSNVYTEGAVVKIVVKINEQSYACKQSQGENGKGGGLKAVR